MRSISVIHPSRSRSEIAIKVLLNWYHKAEYEFEYILAIDSDDPQLRQYTNHLGRFDREYGIQSKCVIGDHTSAIHAINESAKHSTGDILIVISDDFDCPIGWDFKLMAALEGKEDFCVKTKDGIQRTLMTLPILDRKYYDRFGYIYHPDYIHMYSDQEMTAVAHMLGRNLDVDILFPHLHYSTGKFVKDEISVRNDSSYKSGRLVFNGRARTNFGIENPVCKYSDIKWHPK
jgi:hypothetical protein